MSSTLCKDNSDKLSPQQLAHLKFIEEIMWLKCPTPHTNESVNRFIDMYLELAYEIYFGDSDDCYCLCHTYDDEVIIDKFQEVPNEGN